MTSTQSTVNSRLIIGTPYGSEGAYAEIMRKPSSMLKLVLDWKDNPTRNRGMYRMVNGHPVAVDPVHNPLPQHYNPPNEATRDLFVRLRQNGFRLEKGLRSPWYDHECDRPGASPYTIAQELDRDYGGSMFKVFTDDFFAQATKHVRAPFCEVDVDASDPMHPTVRVVDNGPLKLWMPLDSKNRPPDHPFFVGIDLSTGLGGSYTSNSVIEIIDGLMMEQVGELALNTVPPENFSDLGVAVCNWLGGAYMAWERNPPGGGFSVQVKRLAYTNVYYQTMIFHTKRRKHKVPGWWTDDKTKEVLFSELNRIVTTGELKIRSADLVRELHKYIRVGRSILFEGKEREKIDPNEGPSHGDRVMALGVCIQALRDRPLRPRDRPDAPGAVLPGSIEERDRMAALVAGRNADDWDERTNWDLMRAGGTG